MKLLELNDCKNVCKIDRNLSATELVWIDR